MQKWDIVRDAELRLVPLGVITPSGDLDAAVSYALAHPEQALAFLRRHRVVGLGLARIQEACGAGALPRVLTELREFRGGLDEMLDDALDELISAVEETGVPTVGIKGLSMRQLYGRATDRDTGDVDVMVNDVDGAWELTARLRALGYDWCQYEWPWIKRDGASGEIYGQFQVWREFGDRAKRFDVHFGGYSVRHCRRAPYTIDKAGFSLLDPAENVPCLLGNAAGDYLVRLKDVNDTILLLESGAAVDERAKTRSKELGLDGFWAVLVGYARTMANLSPQATAHIANLQPGALARRAVPFGAPAQRRRTAATVHDAFRAGRAQGGIAGGIRTAVSAYGYYGHGLKLNVSPCAHPERADLVADMTNETCIRLIPPRMIRTTAADRAPESGAEPESEIPGTSLLRTVKSAGHGFVVAADGESFVPTIMYDVCSFEAGYHRPDSRADIGGDETGSGPRSAQI